MMQAPAPTQETPEGSEFQSAVQVAHTLWRFVLAARYHKNLVFAIIAAALLLGGLYYATAKRRYSAKAGLLITQSSPSGLDTSITNNESQRQAAMPTFERMISSAKVLEGAIKYLSPEDHPDLTSGSKESLAGKLRQGLAVQNVRQTNILEVSYVSQDPQTSVDAVRAIVQSYLDFMDGVHKGTAGEISRMLTKERQELATKLAGKQQELLDCRRNCADMGFRGDGKALHPMVERAVFFNNALIAAQKDRVEKEALLAAVQGAILNGQDIGQYIMTMGDTVGKEILLNDLGLSNRDISSQNTLQQSLIYARAELQTVRQNLGPQHPQVLALTDKIRLIEESLTQAQHRINQSLTGNHAAAAGTWLIQTLQQKLEESRMKESTLAAKFEETRTEAINLSGQLAQIEMLERDVKRLGDMNDVLLNQIASLDLKQNGQDVRVTVIEEPSVPPGPFSPQLSLTVLVALFGGASISLAAVTLLDAMDDRFRSVDEMQSRLGLPLLSLIHRLDPPASTGPMALITHALPMTTEAESFRTLRTALTLTYPDAHQIVVTSAEPGDGKTTTLANLAVCCAQNDKRTLLIDADLRRPGLTGLMDMRGPRGLSEILRSEGDIAQVAAAHLRPSGIKGLDIIPSGPRPTDPAELLSGPRLSQLLAWAETVYDQIFIDSPPTLATTDTAIIGRLVDGVIIVTQPAKNRRRMVTRVIERLNLMKIPILGFVANRTGSDGEDGYYGYNYGYSYEYTSDGYGHDDPLENESSETSDAYDEEEEPQSAMIPRRVA